MRWKTLTSVAANLFRKLCAKFRQNCLNFVLGDVTENILVSFFSDTVYVAPFQNESRFRFRFRFIEHCSQRLKIKNTIVTIIQDNNTKEKTIQRNAMSCSLNHDVAGSRAGTMNNGPAAYQTIVSKQSKTYASNLSKLKTTKK